MMLQQGADTAAASGAAAAGDGFVWFLIVYAAFYLFRFFRPLLEYAAAGSFRADVERLETLVAQDAEQRAAADPHEERLAALRGELAGVQQELGRLRMEATIALGAGELGDHARLQNAEIPALEEREIRLREDVRDAQTTVRRTATDRLENLSSLRASYSHPLVRQAVQQVAAQFPQSQYQRFDLSLLPGYGAYTEKLAAARSMAGVFVLLGLLGTMIKLNGVVGGINEFTRSRQMEGAEFLEQMGRLMQGIGGAFTNSIWGVVLMVAALVVVSTLNAGVQRRIHVLDTVVSQKVVPTLAEIHNRHLPEFTLADVLRSTGDQLGALDRTVVSLTRGMDEALSGLGTRIGEMLHQFGSYQKQYKQLNDWVATLEGASGEMRKSAGELGRAAARVGQPIDEMNAVLKEHLQAQAQYQASGYLERLLGEIKENLEGGRREQAERAAQSLHVADDALRRAAAAAETVAAGAEAQNRRVETELREVASALRASGGEQIRKLVVDLQKTNDEVARRMDRSAAAFEDAARALGGYAQAPTFFAWLTRTAYPWIARRIPFVRRRYAGARGVPARYTRDWTRDEAPRERIVSRLADPSRSPAAAETGASRRPEAENGAKPARGGAPSPPPSES